MPEEKVQCITRVSTIIMNLLSLSQDKSVPAADDLMPVLVFVSLNCNLSNWRGLTVLLFSGDHQGQPSQLIVERPVCGQLLPGQTGGGTMLLVDAICWSCGVYQDHGLNILCYPGGRVIIRMSSQIILTFTIQWVISCDHLINSVASKKMCRKLEKFLCWNCYYY